MGDRIEQVAPNFWNIRGSYRVMGVLNLGTHASLVRRNSGRYVLLDSYTLSGEIERKVLELTGGGKELEAVINLHPFHTLHVERVAARFPNAWLYGTARHHAKFLDLAWQPHRVEDAKFAELFREDFDFMVPAGVDFIPDNENLHFASVLAFHKASQTLHVDDTLNWIPLPWLKRLDFHPTLKPVLERRPGAVREFRDWARQLIERCETVHNVCTAHAGATDLLRQEPGIVAEQVEAALERVESTLRSHEQRYG